jgi:tetratricopeptide (TPR) repeat protein
MYEPIIPVRRLIAVLQRLGFVGSLLVALGAPFPAAAHGPGQHEILEITEQLASGGARAELYAKRAHIYQNNEMWREAMADLESAARMDSQNARYDLERANLAVAAGEYLRALDFIELYLLRRGDNTVAALIRARAYRALGQFQQAEDSYSAALANLAGYDGRPMPEWYIEYADTLLLDDKTHDALQVLQLGIDRLGTLSVFQVKAAELEGELGLYDSALARIEQLLNQSQRKDLWLARRADFLALAGRDEEARQSYGQAYAALKQLPARLQNLPVSRELADRLQAHVSQQ